MEKSKFFFKNFIIKTKLNSKYILNLFVESRNDDSSIKLKISNYFNFKII
jgi:hypothetical protein